MPVCEWQMNRFERILFRVALVLGGVILVARLGAIAVIRYMHHIG